MGNKPLFEFSTRFKSVRFALSGLREILLTQHNAWIHLFATIATAIAGILVDLSISEWCMLVVVITSVWVAEALNTAFEFLCDVASPEFHPLVKKSKDVAAGAVLISAIGAAIVGVLVFGPKLLSLSGCLVCHDF